MLREIYRKYFSAYATILAIEEIKFSDCTWNATRIYTKTSKLHSRTDTTIELIADTRYDLRMEGT